MACDVKNADLITTKQGHYILALKNNNKHIYQQVSERFAQVKTQLSKNEHIDFGSGRIETRTCYVENDLTLYDDLAHWQHLKSIVIIESKREIKDKVSFETRFYLCDLALEPKEFNQYIRNIGRRSAGALKTVCIGNWILLFEQIYKEQKLEMPQKI